MNNEQLKRIWTDYLDGTELAPEDEQSLADALLKNETLRGEMVSDIQLDGALRALRRVETKDDDFVRRVTNALVTSDSNVDDSPSLEILGDEDTSEPSLTILDEPFVPATVQSSSVTQAVVPPKPIANNSSQSDGSQRRRHAASRNQRTVQICAAVLVMVAVVGAASISAIYFATRDKPVADDRNRPENPAPHIAPRHSNAAVSGKPNRGRQNGSPVDVPSVDALRNAFVDSQDRNVSTQDGSRRPNSRVVVTDDGKPDDRAIPKDTPIRQPEFLAKISHSPNARWETAPNEQMSTETLRLKQGVAEFLMGGGAMVTVVGPAEFRIDSPDSLELAHGRLSATVPEPAIGFTVHTPSSRVIDLGTEFDVSVDDMGTTGVRVRRGEVQLESVKEDGSTDSQWNLRDGEFKWLDKDGNSHDWKLTLALDDSGRGTIRLNGANFELDDMDAFNRAKEEVMREFARFEREFVARSGDSRHESFSGMIDIGGKRVSFDDSKEFAAVRRATTERLDGLGEILNKVKIGRDGFDFGEMKVSPDGVDFGNGMKVTPGGVNFGDIKFGPDGIDFGGLKIDRNGFSSSRNSDPRRPSTSTNRDDIGTNPDRSVRPSGKRPDGSESDPRDIRKPRTSSTTAKHGPLTLNITGAGGDVVLYMTDGEPETGTRTIRGAREGVEVNVAKGQKVILNVHGAGLSVYVPTQIKKYVTENVRGAGNDVKYFTQPGRPDERTRHDPLTIVVEGSSHDIYLKQTDGFPEAGLRRISGTSGDTNIYIGKEQKVTVYLEGSSNDLHVPIPLKGNVEAHIEGSSCDVEYYTERSRFRDRVRTSGASPTKTIAPSKTSPPSTSSPRSKPDVNQRNDPETPRRTGKTDEATGHKEFGGPVLIALRGGRSKVVLDASKEPGRTGIRLIGSITEETSVHVGDEQHVMLNMSGVGNEVIVPWSIRHNISTRISGVNNRILYRDDDGRLLDASGKVVDVDNQQQPSRKRIPDKKSKAPLDPNTLLVLIQGWNQDVIFRESKGRGDYGVKIVEGSKNEITYNVRRDQHVIVMNNSHRSMVFIQESLRDAITVETRGSKNTVDYFE